MTEASPAPHSQLAARRLADRVFKETGVRLFEDDWRVEWWNSGGEEAEPHARSFSPPIL